jgi:hypothetical protein
LVHNCTGLKYATSSGLKNMYRIVAVFLWTLKGWPVRMMRLAMMRVVEGGRSVPDATSVGGESGDEEGLSRVMGSLPKVRGP